MKKLLLTASISTLTLFSTNANAAILGPYVKGSVIGALENDATFSSTDFKSADFDENVGYSAALGFGFTIARGELEVIYNKIDGDGKDFEVEQFSWYANGYVDLDFAPIPLVTPYVGAGLGQTQVKLEDINNDTDDMVFTYQLMAGLNFELTDGITLNAGYRFRDDQELELDLNSAVDFVDSSSHSVEFGVRLGF